MKSEEIDTTIEDLITPERMAKGDLEVAKNLRKKISRAIPANLTLIKELIRRGVLPYHFEVYGVGFLELRNAFRAPWAFRKVTVLEEQWGVGLSTNSADEIYENVCKKLAPWRINVIEFVVDRMKDQENIDHHDSYKECFKLLVSAMDEERTRIYNLKRIC